MKQKRFRVLALALGTILLSMAWGMVVIWYHQPLTQVDCIGLGLEDRMDEFDGRLNNHDTDGGGNRLKLRQLHRIISDDTNPAIAYSYDGRFLAIANRSEIDLYDREAQNILSLPLQTSSKVVQIAFNPTKPYMAVLVNLGQIILFDLGNFTILKTISYPNQVMAIAFTRQGDQLIVSGLGGIGIVVWDTLLYDKSHRLNYRHVADAISVSPISDCIAVAEAPEGISGGAQNVALIELNSGQSQILSGEGYNGQIVKVLYDTTGKMLASFAWGLQFWDVETMQNYREYPEYYNGSWGLGESLFIGVKNSLLEGGRQDIVIFNVDTGEQLGSVTADISTVTEIVANPNDDVFATASKDGTIIVWQIESAD